MNLFPRLVYKSLYLLIFDVLKYSFQHQPNSPNTVGISWSIGNYSIELGQDFNITNTGDQNLTLTLMFSAALTAIGAEKTDYNLGSIAMPNVTLTSHSSRVISANLNSTVPDLNLTEEGGGYFGYSFSVDASIATTYLFWHPTVGYKTFDFNGSIVF